MSTATENVAVVTTPEVKPEVTVQPIVANALDADIVDAAEKSGGTSRQQALVFTMFHDYVEVQMGDKVVKRVSHEDFKQIVNKVDTRQVQEDIKGVLPPSNTIFMSQSGGRTYINCYYPGGKRAFKYQSSSGVRDMEILVPNIIISHSLETERATGDLIVTGTYYYCTDLPISRLPKKFINEFSNDSRIWLLPMSNTYQEGKMCYGQNNMPVRYKDGNLRGLDYFYSFLWDTPFNNDLGIHAVGGVGVSEWYDLLRRCAQEGKPFPYSFLRGWREGDYSKASDMHLSRN